VKLEDVEETLVTAVCERLRTHLDGDEATEAEAFARQYYRWVPPDDLAERTPLDLYGAALSHFNHVRHRLPGEAKVRVYNPQFETDGWGSTHTAVEIVTDDMPFLIDSVSMELTRRSFGMHMIIHPVINVRRDATGRLEEVLPAGPDPIAGALAESVIHAEVDRQTDPGELAELEQHLLRVIGEVRAAVEDWPAMRQRALEIAAELEAAAPPPLDPEDVAEGAALLEWLAGEHFTFLGYRDYDLVYDGGGHVSLCAVAGSGLGILRQSPGERSTRRFDDLPPEVRDRAPEPYLLNLTKANSRATVHRPSFLDYVGIKRFDDEGRVTGERRFLGLYTTTAYNASPREIPILRRKVDLILEKAAFPHGSHNEKALIEILENHPRDEIFQVPVDELFEIAMGILYLGERQRVGLFVRRDTFGRFLSCLVFVPRDRFNTENRRRIEAILRRAFNASSIDYTTRVSESVLVRLHYRVYVEPGRVPQYDAREIETLIVAATRSWVDDLEAALIQEYGEERGNALRRNYAEAFPPAYRADWVARSAVHDVQVIEDLSPDDDLTLTLYRPLEAPEGVLRAKLFRSGAPLALSDMLPVFENMDVKVADERPYEVAPGNRRRPVWIYDFGLVYGGEGELRADRVRESFKDCFVRAWRGDVEDDGFNRLLLRAGLTWREITVLRAIAKYLRQAGTTFSDSYVERSLVGHPQLARMFFELFRARFDPARPDPERAAQIRDQIEQAIDAVESLDEDRILRNFLAVIRAMLRTNYFQREASGAPKLYLSFKLDPSQLPMLPLPRPAFEIFVYSPTTEGVHLRGGKVARGGLRWSDRREDFRTEVLGLMKAQMVKNAVIVPVGAKGGFVVKRSPEARETMTDAVERCYRTFIHGLLDVTDNIAAGKVEPPHDVVRYDGDDPYLVVAADRGTATLSDVANGIAREYGFWLDDAFASGGSTGYDHKKMGITARGAWESVKRHFRELGRDAQNEDFTVVGMGDMSGDVFGNGMLLSRHIRLVGAFDHRHVFVDPNPDPETSFEERRRLFELPRSSWAEYDTSLLSEGGGVYPRTAKSISLSPEAREALGIESDEALTPGRLISAILRAPVDLLWNGGIGTYVKATGETHADAGDKAGDALRVNADELRCRVVGEGGNLGLTQRARIEFALRGGRVNTDAIDNSGGVDCSDHEVNLKVLLDAVVAAGDLTSKQRNDLLVEMTDAVATQVLKDNYEQTETLSLAAQQAASMLDVHSRLITSLERHGLDRELEALPSDEEIAERSGSGGGLTRPELATLVAYSKLDLYRELLESDVPEDPYLSAELEAYFPAPLPERFGARLRDHRLRREITATQVVNHVLHGGGTTFVFRLREETGARPSDIARAYTVAREVFGMRPQWAEVEALDNVVPAETQLQMLLEGRRLVERGTRWFLRNRRQPLAIAEAVSQFVSGAEVLYEAMPKLLSASDAEPFARRADELRSAGVPDDLASRVSSLPAMFAALDIIDVAHETGLDVGDVASVYFKLGSELELHWLRDRIVALPRGDRWSARARAALRDDIYALHRGLTARVLRDGSDVDAWVAANPSTERYLTTLADVRLGRTYDLTTLPVVAREARALLGSPGVDMPSGRSS
jgi:glutamate dehydrogenase